MNPTATFTLVRRRFFIILAVGLLLALAAGLWMLERTGAGTTPVSHISAVAVSEHKHSHPKPHPKPHPKKCDDDRKRRDNDECRAPSGKHHDDD